MDPRVDATVEKLAPADASSSLGSDFWVGQMDLRAISLFRIGMGLIIAYDLLDLLPMATTFFSDWGVMPRVTLLEQLIRPNRFALSDVLGAPEAVYVYWCVAFVAAICTTIGYRTRLSQFVLYVFLAGFNERLPQLFDGGDSVIRLSLFWLCFCPSGHRYSVDALSAHADGLPLAKTSTALPMRIVQAQIAWVYLCSFFHKTGGSTWHDGTALHYVLHLNHVFARNWTTLVADQPILMAIGTYFTLAFEFSFLFLVFSPFYRTYTKIPALLGGVSLHMGIAATVNVGLFSYLMPTAYLCFLEPAWTEKLIGQLARFTSAGPVTVLYDGECPLCRRGMRMLRAMDRFGKLKYVDFRSEDLPQTRTPLSKAALAKRMHAVAPDGTVTEGFLAFQTLFKRLPATFAVAPFMGLPVIDWIGGGIYDWVADRRLQLSGPCTDANCVTNTPRARPPLLGDGARNFFLTLMHLGITTLFISAAWYSCPSQGSRSLPIQASRAVQWFSLWNVWDMFSPEPLRTDYHLRVIAEYSDGSTEDLFGGPADGPGEVRGFFFTRWWKYMENVTGGGETIPREWGRWQCRVHNDRGVGGRKLYTFTLKKENQIIPPMGQPWPPVETVDVWIHRCYDKPGDRKLGK